MDVVVSSKLSLSLYVVVVVVAVVIVVMVVMVVVVVVSPMKIPLQKGRTYLLYKCFFHYLFVPSPTGWVPNFL